MQLLQPAPCFDFGPV